MATDDDKREKEEGESGEPPRPRANDSYNEDDPFMQLGKGIAGISSWFTGLYKKGGFTPFALGLIGIGVIFSIIFFSMDSRDRRDDLVIRIISQWSLIIGVGYFLFKLFLLGVSQTVKAAKRGSAEAPPPAQDTTPPDDIETRLRRLEDLKEKGLLTDAEYQAKREELLGEV